MNSPTGKSAITLPGNQNFEKKKFLNTQPTCLHHSPHSCNRPNLEQSPSDQSKQDVEIEVMDLKQKYPHTQGGHSSSLTFESLLSVPTSEDHHSYHEDKYGASGEKEESLSEGVDAGEADKEEAGAAEATVEYVVLGGFVGARSVNWVEQDRSVLVADAFGGRVVRSELLSQVQIETPNPTF